MAKTLKVPLLFVGNDFSQTDIKSALSFASLTQVGIIVAEIGLGFRYLPLFHLLGHACMRTLQFVRAPSLLQDYRTLEDAIGDHMPRVGTPLGSVGMRSQLMPASEPANLTRPFELRASTMALVASPSARACTAPCQSPASSLQTSSFSRS